ncbi:MAG TPA: histidinol-phosphatase [Clostridia bacterium]|nr:histidinol-phosphatase [Clostridia bacterium]
MGIRANLHTHTTYCDGKNTPLEMVEAAVEKGFHTLGFSGHAYTPFDLSCCMSEEGTIAYRAEIARLRERYVGRIEIFLGIENEGALPQPVDGYEFVIGSLHCLFCDGRYWTLDDTPQKLRRCLDECFGGDFLALAKAYYGALSAYALREKPDIVGHFDLVAKFNESGAFFNPDDPAYRVAALEAVEAIAEAGCIVEINTGAMARGHTAQPYPAPFLIGRLIEMRAPLIVSSDAHDAKSVDAFFPEAEALLSSLGCREVMELRRNEGFVPVSLEGS